MNCLPSEPSDDGRDIPVPTEGNERGPFRFPSKKDDPDTANDEPAAPVSDPKNDEATDDEDLDATGRFRVVEQLNLPKNKCW